MDSSKDKKPYAIGSPDGQVKYIQTSQQAHPTDMKQESQPEATA